jgi:adenosylcobinamide-phosphate synthase
VPANRATAHALGLALGVVADVVLADPRRAHPVAGFGAAAARWERLVYADDRARGVAYTVGAVSLPVLAGAGVERLTRDHPLARIVLTAATTWAVLGGTSLLREGTAMAGHLEAGDLPAARQRLANLCARDPATLDEPGLARATVESLAENTSDAVVAPLLWGAVAGIPGLVGYRAVNTLDAMVGYRNLRYARFGWASARLDDVANLVPARLTGILTAVCAPVVGGTVSRTLHILRRDGGRHPSPNAGRAEAAAAGALGVRLGGANVYHGSTERRPELGDGPPPGIADLPRAVRLATAVMATATGAAVILAGFRGRRSGPARHPGPVG